MPECSIAYYCDDDPCPSFLPLPAGGVVVGGPTGEPIVAQPGDPTVSDALINVCENECNLLEKVEVDGESCLQALFTTSQVEDCNDIITWDKTTNTLNIPPAIYGRRLRTPTADCGGGPLGLATIPGQAWAPGPALPVWVFDTHFASPNGCPPIIDDGPTENIMCAPAEGRYGIAIFADWRASANNVPFNAAGTTQGIQVKRTSSITGNTFRVAETQSMWPVGLLAHGQTVYTETFLNEGDKISYCLYSSETAQDVATVTFGLSKYQGATQSSGQITNPNCPDPL